jgi:hypothetical protein
MENVPTQNSESNSSPEFALVSYIKVHTSKSQTPNNVKYIKVHTSKSQTPNNVKYIKVHTSKSQKPNNVKYINMHIKYTSRNIEAEMGKYYPDMS